MEFCHVLLPSSAVATLTGFVVRHRQLDCISRVAPLFICVCLRAFATDTTREYIHDCWFHMESLWSVIKSRWYWKTTIAPPRNRFEELLMLQNEICNHLQSLHTELSYLPCIDDARNPFLIDVHRIPQCPGGVFEPKIVLRQHWSLRNHFFSLQSILYWNK